MAPQIYKFFLVAPQIILFILMTPQIFYLFFVAPQNFRKIFVTPHKSSNPPSPVINGSSLIHSMFAYALVQDKKKTKNAFNFYQRLDWTEFAIIL